MGIALLNVKSTQAFGDGVVKEIFAAAQSWEAWASIKDFTPLLAEASPNAFIEVVQKASQARPDYSKN